jgi:hypothetical protein
MNQPFSKPHDSIKLTFKKTKKKLSRIIYFQLDLFFPVNNWQAANDLIQL